MTFFFSLAFAFFYSAENKLGLDFDKGTVHAVKEIEQAKVDGASLHFLCCSVGLQH